MLRTQKHSSHTADFTKDMLHTLIEYFEYFSDDEDVVSVEINRLGIWLDDPVTKAKKFVGKARLSTDEKTRLEMAQSQMRPM